MDLPFSRAEFFDVFAAYNTAWWPAAIALWAVSLGLVIRAFGAGGPPHRALSALLAVHWTWSALAYHAAYFSRINPAAWIFAALFLVQAGIFVWLGMVHDRLRFSTGRSARHVAAGALIAYALAYPLINAALGHAYPRAPTFGVPCPTAIFTVGLLLASSPPRWDVSVIPILWSAIGGSAAVLLGVRADLALPVAGALLVVRLLAGHRGHEWAPNQG